MSSALDALPALAGTTLYVWKHFEVRDHDQPTKYVFNGAVRVARVTGSLSTNSRVQRLRVHPGWNLCTVAVEGSPLPRDGGNVGFTSIGEQVWVQAKAVGVTVVWTAVVAFIAFKIADLIVGLRVTDEEEREGLDVNSHGEAAYHG